MTTIATRYKRHSYRHKVANEDGTLDMQASLAFLERMTRGERLCIPGEVLMYIAQQPDKNLANLHDSLVRIVAYSALTKTELSVELAEVALSETVPSKEDVSQLSTKQGTYLQQLKPAIELTTVKTNVSGGQKSPRRLIRSTSNRRPRKFTSVIFGFLQAFGLCIAGISGMLVTCLLITIVNNQIGINNPTIKWIWWMNVVINGLTVFIPIDLYRFTRNRSAFTLIGRVRVMGLLIMNCGWIAFFIFGLALFPGADIHVVGYLGFLNR